MKNWLKTLCTAAVVGSMALTVAAEDAAANALTLPELVHAEQIQITSSLASDNADLVPLYDLSADTAVTFAGAAEGVSVSMTTKEAFRLHSIVVNETETEYEAALYASNDGENWVEVKFDTKEEDGFVIYKAKGLTRDSTVFPHRPKKANCPSTRWPCTRRCRMYGPSPCGVSSADFRKQNHCLLSLAGMAGFLFFPADLHPDVFAYILI